VIKVNLEFKVQPSAVGAKAVL